MARRRFASTPFRAMHEKMCTEKVDNLWAKALESSNLSPSDAYIQDRAVIRCYGRV